MFWKWPCGICHYCPMANNDGPEMPETLPGDELPPFPAAQLPAEPAELEAWREEYVRALVDHHPGGVGAPWRS